MENVIGTRQQLQTVFGYLLNGAITEPYIFLLCGDLEAVESIANIMERLYGTYLVTDPKGEIEPGVRVALIRGTYDANKVLAIRDKVKIVLAIPGPASNVGHELDPLMIWDLHHSDNIPKLSDIEKEMSGILNWALEGSQRYLKRGL